MKIFEVNEHIKIECQPFKRGFGHTAYLYRDNVLLGRSSIRYYNRTWECYEYESVMYKVVENNKQLTKKEKETCQEFIKNYTPGNPFKGIAAVAKMGEIFCESRKDKNDWKARMIQAGIPEIDMPDDWSSLPEEEKEARLNKIISELSK